MTAGDIPEPLIASLGSLCGGSAVVADGRSHWAFARHRAEVDWSSSTPPGCDFVAMLQRPECKSRRQSAREHVICRLQIETYPAARRPQACENRKQLLPTASDGASGLIRPLRPIVAVLGPPPAVVPTCQKPKKAPGKLGSQGGKGL